MDRVPDAAVTVGTLASSQPQNVQTPKIRGDEHTKAGRYADAEQCYRQVMEVDADYPASRVMHGFVLREQGRTDEAREILELAVCIAPEDADGHYLLSSVLEASGSRDREILHLQKAIDLRSDFELARRQLIVALFKSERYAEATTLCEESIELSPNSAELQYYRSNLYLQSGEKPLAIASCNRALALDPGLIGAQRSLSWLLLEMDQLEQTEISYRREIQLTPEYFGPYHMLGVVLSRLGRHREAIELYKQAISLNPESSASYCSLAAAYIALDDTSAENLAIAHANNEKAAALEPNSAEIQYSMGISYWPAAQYDRAMACFDRAIEIDPSHAAARWTRAMLWARIFSSNGANDSPERSQFGVELARFEDWWVKSESDGEAFVGQLQPFFLAYQEADNLALLKQYGRLCSLSMQRWLERQTMPAFKRAMEKRIRLGIISSDIRFHSIWIALTKGWMQSFDPERFELVVFSLRSRALADSETAWARAKSDVFLDQPKNVSQWVAAIREQNCEILLYPGIGLDHITLMLASLRLAPVQINSWGHPDTSGLPTLDYFLSADCFEPANAQDHYSERLIRLPHLGNRLQPLNLDNLDPHFDILNIDLERPTLVCPGSPFKYQPAHDHIFLEIARRIPAAQLVFILPTGAVLSNLLQDRITNLFETAGLRMMEHVRFIRWLNLHEYHCFLRQAEVLLDTIGFSGYNTAAQAMECGIPLVTLEGRFLRGRLASGVLRRMGLHELIVPTKTDYVNLVVRLVTDPDYHAHICREIEQRRSVLFDDQSAMGPLQDFLESVARPAAPP